MRVPKLTLLLVLLLIACQSSNTGQSVSTTGRSDSTTIATTTTRPAEPVLPPVVGPDPSYRVAAFYYPWYHSQETDGISEPWSNSNKFTLPYDIASDYYPLLGPYSSSTPAIVAQHFAWLRQAGVGVIISSWWGQGDYTDTVVPVLLEQGERYGIKVAFHIEPREGRNAASLVDDIRYLYDRYGASPAFYRTDKPTKWSSGASKGLFFLWAAETSNFQDSVESGYWLDAMDQIHALPQSAMVIANTLQSSWVDASHFDGLYNYVSQHLEETSGFTWAEGIPKGAWYVPSVTPGVSARRLGYSDDTYQPRLDGETYRAQWEAALGLPFAPDMMTITSFNEWLEGTQIEPSSSGVDNGSGYIYTDYESLGSEGYLQLTLDWVEQLAARSWPPGATVQIRLSTSSDWTFARLASGAEGMRTSMLTASEAATSAGIDGDRIGLTQSLSDAEDGDRVEVTMDMYLAELDPAGEVQFDIGRGHIGSTQLQIFVHQVTGLVDVGTFTWDGINAGEENMTTVAIPTSSLLTDSG
jgi:glycoprotein endo-alpha-1,2-mannosidase